MHNAAWVPENLNIGISAALFLPGVAVVFTADTLVTGQAGIQFYDLRENGTIYTYDNKE